MASNVAENKDSRDWVAAQWWKSGDNTPDNLSGLSLYAVPALGQTTGFGKTNTPKFNSTELEGTVLFWVDILSKGIPMLPYLDHIKTEANFSLEVCFCFLYNIQI